MSENLREIVNGGMLSQFMGKRVTIIGLVTNVNANGLTFDIKAVDDVTVKVNLRQPNQDALTGHVEVSGLFSLMFVLLKQVLQVHGTVQGGNTVICDHFVQFPISSSEEEFDSTNHNMLTSLLQNVPGMWKTTA